MLTLDTKLLRDLRLLRGQSLAIALVIAAGVAMFTMYFSTFESLDHTHKAYYDRYRFADVFASLKRAPLATVSRIEALPGVARVEPRVVVQVTLDVEEMTEPAVGLLLSIPEHRRTILNDVYLVRGRYIQAGRPDEVLVIEAFALAHGLEPGDVVGAVINGRRRELEIVGRGPFTGVRLHHCAGRPAARRQAVRRLLDGTARVGLGLRHGGRLQRRVVGAEPGSFRGAGDCRRRQDSQALRRSRSDPAPAPGLCLVCRQRDAGDADDGLGAAGSVLVGGRFSLERGALAHHLGAARPRSPRSRQSATRTGPWRCTT